MSGGIHVFHGVIIAYCLSPFSLPYHFLIGDLVFSINFVENFGIGIDAWTGIARSMHKEKALFQTSMKRKPKLKFSFDLNSIRTKCHSYQYININESKWIVQISISPVFYLLFLSSFNDIELILLSKLSASKISLGSLVFWTIFFNCLNLSMNFFLPDKCTKRLTIGN